MDTVCSRLYWLAKCFTGTHGLMRNDISALVWLEELLCIQDWGSSCVSICPMHYWQAQQGSLKVDYLSAKVKN